MKTGIVTPLLMMFIFTFLSSFKKKESLHFHGLLRTDGYYFYDNRVDTFIIIPDSKELYDMTIEFLREEKHVISKKKSRCLPDNVAVLDGSSFTGYLAFFSDTTGTVINDACRDEQTIRENVEILLSRKNGFDTGINAANHRISHIDYTRDSIISFLAGDDAYFKELYTGTIYKDSLVLNVYRVGNPMSRESPNAHRLYHFIPYAR